jgi:hypothetical protein
MISTIVIGFAYNLLQMALSIFTVVSGNRILNGDGGYKFDFYGDKVHLNPMTSLQIYEVIFHNIFFC